MGEDDDVYVPMPMRNPRRLVGVDPGRLAAAEKVVEAALGELAAIAQYDPRWTGVRLNDAPGRQQIVERAYDAWVALSAPPTGSGAHQ